MQNAANGDGSSLVCHPQEINKTKKKGGGGEEGGGSPRSFPCNFGLAFATSALLELEPHVGITRSLGPLESSVQGLRPCGSPPPSPPFLSFKPLNRVIDRSAAANWRFKGRGRVCHRCSNGFACQWPWQFVA
jgi:hypothetical protein